MSDFSTSMSQALSLLVRLDSDLWEIVALSFKVSLSAVMIATAIGLPIGAALATKKFPGHGAVRILVDTLMAMPPVVIGLIAYLLLSRSGPLGVFGLLYTPSAMIIAQTLLITPIIVALSQQVFGPLWLRLGDQLRLLNTSTSQTLATLFHEGRHQLLTVWLAGFGRAIAEIGAVMMVGGNIDHYTRVMTTAIALETSKGNLEMAMALGIILMIMALFINILAHSFSRLQRGTVS